MSLEKLIGSAFRDGAGISLRKVMKSESYQKKLARKLELNQRFGRRTHRGIALRVGPTLFGNNANTVGEKQALATLRQYSMASTVHTKILATETLIEELGERLVDAAANEISLNGHEMAKGYRSAKSADEQIAVLKGLKIIINQMAKERPKPPGDETASATIPVGYEWIEDYFGEQNPHSFLPKKFKRLPKHKGPNCLGMSILLAGWAKLAGAKCLFCTEIVHHQRQDYRFQETVTELVRATLRGLSGQQARNQRKAMREDLQDIRGWQHNVRDWHHAIAIELMDGRWFYLDPYTGHAHVFPKAWEVPLAAKCLRKYHEVLPGLSLMGHDHGAQERHLERFLAKFLEIMAQAEAARYKLTEDPGGATMRDLLAIAPELEYLCDLLVDNDPDWPRPPIAPWHRLGWLMVGWKEVDGRKENKAKEEIEADLRRYQTDARFRREKLDELIVHFCEQALAFVRRRGQQIHPALEFSDVNFGVGITVLSNLSSWTEEKVPGTLLLEHGNSQMLWHEAVSPIPELGSLEKRHRTGLRYSGNVLAMLPQHDRVRLKLQAMQQFLNYDREKEE